MYERFSERARKVLLLANQEAQRFNHECIGTEYLLLAILKAGGGAINILKHQNIDPEKVRAEVYKSIQPGQAMVTMGRRPHTPRVKRAITWAENEATDLGCNFVGTEHLLLGILHEGDGMAAKVLDRLGLKMDPALEDARNPCGGQEGTLL